MFKGFIFSTFPSTLTFFSFVYSHPTGHGFDLHFHTINNIEQLFTCLLAICVSSLEKCFFQVFRLFFTLMINSSFSVTDHLFGAISENPFQFQDHEDLCLFFSTFLIVVQVQLSPFSSHPSHPHFPPLILTLWFHPCVLYACSENPSPLCLCFYSKGFNGLALVFRLLVYVEVGFGVCLFVCIYSVR